jgi:hypothetical protein
MTPPDSIDERIVILTPFGRDGDVIAQVLARGIMAERILSAAILSKSQSE